MTAKLIIEFDDGHQAFSLDDLMKSFLQAVQSAMRQEIERALSSDTILTSQYSNASEVNPPVALSKVRAAQILGVSVRTIDNCISKQKIRVLRIGRRVLVPMNSIEAALKRGVLETHGSNGRSRRRQESSPVQET
jgi:excisionase family DNA binding protein